MRSFLSYKTIKLFLFICVMVGVAGCVATQSSPEKKVRQDNPDSEAEWIRNGEPIEFEGEFWYPQDAYEVLLDSEVFRIGEYGGVNFFIENIDVRPYNQLYTKFGRNKYRIFRKDAQGD